MPTAKLTKARLFTAICAALALGTFALYWPITHNGFTNFDDDAYITGNPHVTRGLTWNGVIWAFKTGYAANWHPLTWISHMVDCQLFGLNPAGHHLVNLLFHIANTLLLFILLNYLTGAIWRSAFVAALFAVHPMHVESVAWASERKDVLSAFFWMLSLLAYAKYAKNGLKNVAPPPLAWTRSFFYWLAVLFFACGLMSKPMVVTLPFVLLLLDVWPLQRFSAETAPRLVIEKIPFFILSLAGSVVTYLVQQNSGAVTKDSLSYRMADSLWAYLQYISKLICPSDLSIFYPYPAFSLFWPAIFASLVLAVCTIAFLRLFQRFPSLMIGWLWFLGVLVPAIGIVHVGSASMADRYSYLPGIGLFILITWGLADLFRPTTGKILLPAAALIALAACALLTSIQIKYWRNSITLFQHSLAVTTDNYVACACLGQALDVIGDEKDAFHECAEAVRLNPDYAPGQFFLGTVLWKTGNFKEAFTHLNLAARADPSDAGFQYNLGKFLVERNEPDRALPFFNTALQDNPDFAEAHNALGKTLLKLGKSAEAAGQLSQAVTLEPDNPDFHYDLGTVLSANSQFDPAIAQFSEAVRLEPGLTVAWENRAVTLAKEGKLSDAIEDFSKVVQLTPNNIQARFNLGFAYLNNHQPVQAASQFSEELRLAPNETSAHYRLAQALLQENKPAEAVSHYRKALQLTPDFPDAKKALDEILAAHPELH